MFKQWLAARTKAWRDGFKTASAEQLPDAVEVIYPFLVVKLAGGALDENRLRIQQGTTGHCVRVKDPLYYRARRTLHASRSLLMTRQQERIVGLYADPNLAKVEVTWSVYQDIVTAYRTTDSYEGKKPFCRQSSTPCRQDCQLGWRN